MIGFPRTCDQVESLVRTSAMAPSRVFFLNISLDVVSERLTQHPTDIDETIQKRYQAYSIYSDDLQDFYSQLDAIHIPADQDAYTVFEAVEAGIVNPLNTDRS